MKVELNRLTLFSGPYASEYVLSLARQWRTRPGQGVFRNWQRMNGFVFLPHFGAGVSYSDLPMLTESVAQVVGGSPYCPVILASDSPAVIYTINNMMQRHLAMQTLKAHLDPSTISAYICEGPAKVRKLPVVDGFLSEADLLPNSDEVANELNQLSVARIKVKEAMKRGLHR